MPLTDHTPARACCFCFCCYYGLLGAAGYRHHEAVGCHRPLFYFPREKKNTSSVPHLDTFISSSPLEVRHQGSPAMLVGELGYQTLSNFTIYRTQIVCTDTLLRKDACQPANASHASIPHLKPLNEPPQIRRAAPTIRMRLSIPLQVHEFMFCSLN